MTARDVEPRFEPVSSVSPVIRAIGLGIVFLVMVSGAFAVVQLGILAWQHGTLNREVRDLKRTLEPWRQNPPPDVKAHAWEEAYGFVTQTAVVNICFSPELVSHAEVRRLKQDVEAKVAEGPASAETLDWLWRRLAQTGPQGVKYTTHFQPMWDDMKGRIEPPQANTQASGSHSPDGN